MCAIRDVDGSLGMDVTGAGIARLPIPADPLPPPGESLLPS